jgi:hypothetical protein
MNEKKLEDMHDERLKLSLSKEPPAASAWLLRDEFLP